MYLLKVNNRNTRTRSGICLKLTIKTQERRHWHRSGIFMVNFEHISHLVLVFLLLTLIILLPAAQQLNVENNVENVENNITTDHAKHITTHEYNKLG